jgi:hypothetical protein
MDLQLTLTDEHKAKSKEELLPILDLEVERFSKWLAERCPDPMARGPLSNPERALIKTYLVQKLAGRVDGGE